MQRFSKSAGKQVFKLVIALTAIFPWLYIIELAQHMAKRDPPAAITQSSTTIAFLALTLGGTAIIALLSKPSRFPLNLILALPHLGAATTWVYWLMAGQLLSYNQMHPV